MNLSLNHKSNKGTPGKMRFLFNVLFFLIIIFSFLCGCARRPLPDRFDEWAPPVKTDREITSRKNEIIASISWDQDDKEEKRLRLITPPGAILELEIEDYALNIAPETTANTDYPSLIRENVKIQPQGFIRYYYVQSLTVRPELRYLSRKTPENQDGERENISLKKLTFRLKFQINEKNSFECGNLPGKSGENFSRIIHVLTDNPEAAGMYGCASPPLSDSSLSDFETNTPLVSKDDIPVLNLYTKADGIYKIDHLVLEAGGINPDNVNPRKFHLFCGGREIPLALWGCMTGRFTELDSLFFYAFEAENPYAEKNVFQLVYDPDSPPNHMPRTGKKIADDAEKQEHFIRDVTLEQDNHLKIHSGNFLSIKGMRWVWGEIQYDKKWEHSFDLPGHLPLPGKGTVSISLYCHPQQWRMRSIVECKLNSEPVQSFTVKSEKDDTFEFEMPYNNLKKKDNVIRISILRPESETEKIESIHSGIFLDHITLQYPSRYLMIDGQLEFTSRADKDQKGKTYTILANPDHRVVGFEKSDIYAPSFLTPEKTGRLEYKFSTSDAKEKSYLFTAISRIRTPLEVRPAEPADISDPGNAADYVIITHPDFMAQARKLGEFRKEQGMDVKIVDVQSIYDEFNYGLLSPHAIKYFLSTTLLEWKSPPDYILFIGDACSDYKNDAKNDVKNFVPSYSQTSRVGSQDNWASEHWFTTLVGSDEYPDIILGRLSVNNPQDAENVVNKIIHYESEPEIGPWRARLGYVADDGPFDETAEEMRTKHTPDKFAGRTVYLEELPLEDNYYLSRSLVEKIRAKVSGAATANILRMFHDGVLHLCFFGHGSPNIWSDERIWFGGDSRNSDNLRLKNYNRLPLVTNMTCNSGAIDYPVPKWNVCIAEDCMRQKDGGAVAVFAPSGPGYTSSHKRISAKLRESLFQHGLFRLGEAVTAARCLYLLENYPVDIMQMFIFLGDPTTSMQTPRGNVSLEIPKRVYSYDETPASLDINASVDSPKYGKCLLSLYSPDNKLIYESEEIDYSNGTINHRLPLPETDREGEWIIRAYCMNQKEKKDAVGALRVIVSSPYLALSNPRIDRPLSDISRGDNIKLSVEVKNDSLVECPGAAVSLEDLSRGGEARVANQSVEPGEKKEFSWDVKAAPGMNVFRFRLNNHARHPDPEKPRKDVEMIAFAAASENAVNPDLAFPEHLLDLDYSQVEDKARMSAVSQIFNLGSEPAEEVTVNLRSGKSSKGAVLKSVKIGSLSSLIPRKVNLNTQLDNPRSGRYFTIEAIAGEKTNESEMENNVFTFEHNVENLSDLAIREDGIILSKQKPTEGETVFFDVPVVNRGKGAAEDAVMAMFDDKPGDGGKMLFNYMGSSHFRIPYLKPGSEKYFRLRWDPVKNRGKNTIYIKVDALNRIPELNENNNVETVSLYVRSKADLKPAGIDIVQTEQDINNLEAKLVARVENRGETEARNVSVRFYKSRIQIPETLVGETLIPKIGPGETAETEFQWKLESEEEARFTYNPSILVFLKGSNQRFSSVEDEENSGEENEEMDGE